MFLAPLPQGPRCFTDVFFTTVYGFTLVTVYYSTLLFHEVLVLVPYQHLFEGPVASEVGLNATLGVGAFDAYPQALNISDYYVAHTGSSPGGDGCLTVTTGDTHVIDCGEEYISETSRTLGERYKEHLREPSPIQAHSQLAGHQFSPDNFNIIGRLDQDLTRLIKVSIYIRVNNPALNRI